MVVVSVWIALALWYAWITFGEPGERAHHLPALIAVGMAATGALAWQLFRATRRAERASLNAAALSQIIGNAQDVIWVIDAQARMVFLNEATRPAR